MTRRRLKLVWRAPSSPPPERMAVPAVEFGLHMDAFKRESRDQRYRARFAKRARALQDRMCNAAIYDCDDISGVVAVVLHEVVAPMARRDGDPNLIFAGAILEKALKWLLAQPPAGSDPPRLVG